MNSKNSLSKSSTEFKKHTKSSTHNLKWRTFKWKGDKSWFEGSENLIYRLRFVIEEDVFIYLGFDLDGIELPDSIDRNLENLVFILHALDGVSKTWIKFRPDESSVEELYISTWYGG